MEGFTANKKDEEKVQCQVDKQAGWSRAWHSHNGTHFNMETTAPACILIDIPNTLATVSTSGNIC